MSATIQENSSRLPAKAEGKRALGDRLFRFSSLAAAWVVPLLMGLMVVLLLWQSRQGFFRFGLGFLSSKEWDSNQGEFGALTFIYGTLVTSLFAMLFAIPLGVGAAAFLAEIAPDWFRKIATFLVELLAAIPSVVYGFWGVFFLVPFMQQFFTWMNLSNRSGRGLLTSGILLAIMIVPFITAIAYDICRAVPASQRQGALALGATRWQMIWTVVLPYARPGILGGCFLALGRALGETMAVAMLIGNNTSFQLSPFGLGYSIPSLIANELPTASTDLHRSALVELGLVLLGVTVGVNSLARALIWRVERTAKVRPAPEPVLPIETGSRPALNMPAAFTTRVAMKGSPWAGIINQFMTVALFLSLLVILIPLFHILGYIAWKGLGDLTLAFFLNRPIDTPPGLGHSLLGSAIMVGLATVIAVPIAILAALFLSENRTSRLAPVVRFLGELLGGVPSIVIGIFGYALIVIPFGFSAYAGAFALGVMMIPVVMRSSEEALRMVPGALRNASYALGASHSQTVFRVILPAAMPAIVTGVFLGIARIAGETAPLLFTAYNSSFWPNSLAERTPFLTYYIYNYSLSDSLAEQKQAWAGAFVLLAFVMLLNLGIRVLAGKRLVQASHAD